MGGKRRPGPKHPQDGLPAEDWPMVLHRVVENNEPLRQVADEYDVSHETIRRLILHAKPRGQPDAEREASGSASLGAAGSLACLHAGERLLPGSGCHRGAVTSVCQVPQAK